MAPKLISIKNVKPNSKNPRLIKDAKYKVLLESLKNSFWMMEARPIVVDENMVVLGGNQRLRACQELKYKEVWVEDGSKWTKEQQQEFIIKDNTNYGEWDYDMLGNEWDEKDLLKWGMDVWQPENDEGYVPPDNPFDDDDKGYKSQYGVIVTCDNEKSQEEVFKSLSAKGYKCKVVVT